MPDVPTQRAFDDLTELCLSLDERITALEKALAGLIRERGGDAATTTKE